MTGDSEAIAIIGGSRSLVPFIEATTARELDAIVFDRDADAAGRAVASEFHAISTHHTSAVLATLRPHRDRLAGCFTYSSYEGALRTTGAVVTEFGLRGLDAAALDRTWTKPRLLEALSEAGLPVTQWLVTDEPAGLESMLSDHERVVVKPARGGVGSTGVSVVERRAPDLSERLTTAVAASSDDTALVEAFLSGVEYSVDGFVASAKPTVLLVSRKHIGGPDGGVLMAGFVAGAAVVPAEVRSRVEALVGPVLEAAGLDDSYFSLDVIDTGDDVFVIDAGPLLDAKIDRLLHHSGVDVYGIAPDLARGAPVEPGTPAASAVALRFLYAAEPGRLTTAESGPITLAHGQGVLEFERDVGGVVRPPESVSDIVGWIAASGDDANALWAALESVDTSGRVEVSP